jgi:hypothetical protein
MLQISPAAFRGLLFSRAERSGLRRTPAELTIFAYRKPSSVRCSTQSTGNRDARRIKPIAILLDKREGLFLGCPLCDSNVCGDLSPRGKRFPRHLFEPAGDLIELPFAGERGGLVPGQSLALKA